MIPGHSLLPRTFQQSKMLRTLGTGTQIANDTCSYHLIRRQVWCPAQHCHSSLLCQSYQSPCVKAKLATCFSMIAKKISKVTGRNVTNMASWIGPSQIRVATRLFQLPLTILHNHEVAPKCIRLPAQVLVKLLERNGNIPVMVFSQQMLIAIKSLAIALPKPMVRCKERANSNEWAKRPFPPKLTSIDDIGSLILPCCTLLGKLSRFNPWDGIVVQRGTVVMTRMVVGGERGCFILMKIRKSVSRAFQRVSFYQNPPETAWVIDECPFFSWNVQNLEGPDNRTRVSRILWSHGWISTRKTPLESSWRACFDERYDEGRPIELNLKDDLFFDLLLHRIQLPQKHIGTFVGRSVEWTF